MKLLGRELTFNNNEIWHKGNLDPSIFRVKQNKYVTTTAGTAAYYRVATIPMSSIFKNTIFKVKAYTPTGTTTESTIIVDIAYYAGNYSSQTSAVSALTSHSYNSDTTAENGWVLRYCRVSFDADYGYIDLYVNKNSVVTIEIEPLVESDWIWATGSLTANPAVGSLKNVQVTMATGFRASNIVATSADSATYSNYGTLGTTTISNTTDKTGQWAYFGYFTISYNASYLRGHCANIRVRLQEINHDGTKNLADLDDFVLILKASMPYHANSTEFNTKVPSIHIEIEGKTSISPNDVAGLVYSTSTSTKTIRFYIRLKEANTVYQINPEQRYGRSFATSSYSATTSYFYFTYAGTQTPVTSLPTPAQGSIVYAVKRTIDADTLNGKFAEDFALRNHTHTITNITNLQSTLDAKAPLASPNFTGVPTAPTAPNGTNTNQIATTAFVQNALSAGGYGDMLKSQYDTDSDGIVDRAETADKLTTARTISLSGDVVGSTIFDGSADISINTTRLIKNNSFILDSLYTFTRSSTAYLSDGTLVNMNLPRFEQGKFGKGVLVEEGTENKYSADQSQGLNPGRQGGSTVTATPGQLDPFGGTNAVRIQASGGTLPLKVVYSAYAPASGVACSGQIWVRNRSITPLIVHSNMGGRQETVLQSDGWKKIIWENIIGNGNGVVQHQLRVPNVDDEIDCDVAFLQYEEKPYCTSWQIGGTARSAEVLTIPTEGVLNPQEGTVECWAYVNSASKYPNRFATIFIADAGGSGRGIWLYHENTANYWRYQIKDENNIKIIRVPDSEITDGWHYFAITWNALEAKLFVDGILKGTIANPPLPSTTIRIDVGHWNGTNQFNSLIDDLRISNRARTDAEILAAYQSNEPLPYDAYTTWLSRFDNNYGLIGNSSNQIPVSNGILCTNLNAERTNGIKITASTIAPTSPQINDIWIDLN